MWGVNTWLQANGAYINQKFLQSFQASISGQPAWLAHYIQAVVAAIQVLGPSRVAIATVVVDGLLAFSLLTGLWLRFFAWLGIAYNLFMWSAASGLGGPYGQGATDPGTSIVYALAFVFVLTTQSQERWSLAAPRKADFSLRFFGLGRILFGLLWAFDAFLKWQPYFLHHAVTYLVQAQQGQPAWIVSYIQFFVNIIQAVGPFAFGLAAAVTETVIALSLLFKARLDLMLPLGLVYTFGLWTTAEGWGGPYRPGFTGSGGDLVGTAIIYCLIFLFMMAVDPPLRIAARKPT